MMSFISVSQRHVLRNNSDKWKKITAVFTGRPCELVVLNWH